MATKVIMPALGMAQETGKLLAWLKQEGETVIKGEPLMEIETDKAAVEIEASASGLLGGVSVEVGQEVPVGQVIAWILEPGEEAPATEPIQSGEVETVEKRELQPERELAADGNSQSSPAPVEISPVARNIAQEHDIDLLLINRNGTRIEKADVLAYINQSGLRTVGAGIILASPKARRMANEYGLALNVISGSGPDGAVLAADVVFHASQLTSQVPSQQTVPGGQLIEVSRGWAVMADRLAEAWRTIPHFYLEREINASQMIAWRNTAQKNSEHKITFTDLLLKAVAAALEIHPRVNAAWINDSIYENDSVHIGVAVATDDGLAVPVIPNTNMLSIGEIAVQRQGVVTRALDGKLKMKDLQGGTFTISNLGMFGVDRFSAIVNPPQAAILAVGKIVDKAIPEDGQINIYPTMTLTLSCDHRVVDGARGAKFLDTLAQYLEEPLQIL